MLRMAEYHVLWKPSGVTSHCLHLFRAQDEAPVVTLTPLLPAKCLPTSTRDAADFLHLSYMNTHSSPKPEGWLSSLACDAMDTSVGGLWEARNGSSKPYLTYEIQHKPSGGCSHTQVPTTPFLLLTFNLSVHPHPLHVQTGASCGCSSCPPGYQDHL